MGLKTLLLVLLLASGAVLLKYIAELDSALAQIYAAIVLAFFNLVFIAILFWDRWTDTPNLKIKMEDKTEILDHRYALKISVLNRGRKDAYNCRVSVQVFDQKSRKKIGEYHSAESDLKLGETKPFHISGVIAFKRNVVARISAETHKSKDNKILEYTIKTNYDLIIFKWGFIQSLRYNLKHLFEKYQSGWDTEVLADGLTIFPDQNIRKELIEKLGEIGDDKVTCQLIDCLKKDTSMMVSDRAADALGNIGDKRAVDPLLECLKEGKVDPFWCTSAIVKICDQEGVKKLIGILRDSNNPPHKRRVVAESLGELREELRNENVEEALIEALKDFDGDDFCGVVGALGKVGGEKALKKLENIKDCNNIRKKAIEQIQFRISVGGDNIEGK